MPGEKTKQTVPENLLPLLREDVLNLLLVRHGLQDQQRTYGKWIGAALSETGKAQAALVARRLSRFPITQLYCSDMARSYQTCQAVRRLLPETPWEVMPDMREISVFQVRGRKIARTVEARSQLHEERSRVARFAEHLRTRHHHGELVAVIGHNGLNGMLLAELDRLAYRRSIRWISSHTSLSLAALSLSQKTVALRVMGCVAHLSPDLITS